MRVDKIGVHKTHCCILHGCKYGDHDCPVVNAEVRQDYFCETCSFETMPGETSRDIDNTFIKISRKKKLEKLNEKG